jgi:hypothetical protein
MTIVRYVVPAGEPLTVLHIYDEDRYGYTRCGRTISDSELWRPIECRQEDRLCPDCVRGGPADDEDQMLLPM